MKIKQTFWLIITIASLASGVVLANEDILAKLSNLFGINGGSPPPPTQVMAAGTIEVAFSPDNGATATVVKAIREAKQTILVSAYSFTSKEIANALLNAKKSGVVIKLILDKSQATQKYSSATFFANHGFAMKIAVMYAIYHDKVMIIDGKTVITGSFNFTRAAEAKNAENVLVIRNNPNLARLYARDWWYNWNQAITRDEFLAQKAASRNWEDDE